MTALCSNYLASMTSYLYFILVFPESKQYPSEGLSILTRAFLNKLIDSNEKAAVYNFIESLIESSELITQNIKTAIEFIVHNFTPQNFDMDAIRSYYLCFRDKDDTFWHFLDLQKYYRFESQEGLSEDIKNSCVVIKLKQITGFKYCFVKLDEPMRMSFKYFVDEWRKELESLTAS